MRVRTLQRPCPHGREQPPSANTKGVRGLGPRTFSAKRRNQSLGEAQLSPGSKTAPAVRRPAQTPHLSEANLKEAARPPVVLGTVGRRSFVALSP
jgi:hypothetical protein